MMRNLLTISLVAGLTILATGCDKKRPNPQPEDTVLGSSASKERADWTNSADAYTEGLFPRNAAEAAQFMDVMNNPANKLTSVYFSFDRSNIGNEEKAKVDEVIQRLNSEKGAEVLVVGHCDWHGTHEYNMALGDRRASSILAYISQSGIEDSRIKTLSKGDNEAIREGTPEQTHKDRRADLFIVK